MERLSAGGLINDISKLQYHRDCGISFDYYSEFFINIEHPRYFFIDLHSEWPAIAPLKFQIGEISIEVGDASPLIVLLMESHYHDSDFHYDSFNTFASIRLHGVNYKSAENIFHKALFHINSYYFKPVRLVASLRNVKPNFDDPLGLFYGATSPEETFNKIIRTNLPNWLTVF